MTNANLISMIGNVSQSLIPVQGLIKGLAYVLGILFIVSSFTKFKKIAESHGQGSSQQKSAGPFIYLVVGAALLFLPSMIRTLSNTAFGSGNVLQYSQYNPYDIYSSMEIVIQTAGLIWFVRGCSLVVHMGEPGHEETNKGFLFIMAGIFAINFRSTYGFIDYAMTHLLALTHQS